MSFERLNFTFGVFSGTKGILMTDTIFPEAKKLEVEVSSGAASPPLEIELSAVDAVLLLMTQVNLWSDVACI